jgi:3-deoxy-manno-octulosonate cytidylyltransferase (CMP-KDO synthetase)
MASSRFPGKPLVPVQGLPMIEHVRRRTLLCRRFSEVAVATCDVEIAAVVRENGGKVLMTASHHPAATDRVAEAVRQLDCSHVVNVQGDEILVLPSDLERMVSAIEQNPAAPAWNALARVESEAELSDRSIVKCVVSFSERVLFCSRDFSSLASPLSAPFRPVLKVLGILGYRRDFLERYLALSRTPLEIADSIDQSRILEPDVPLQGVTFTRGYLGLNEPRELEMVHSVLRDDPLQQKVLQQVLSGAGNGV